MQVLAGLIDSPVSSEVSVETLELLIRMGKEMPFYWWLRHPRQHAALVELGRLAKEFPGSAIPMRC